MTADLAHDVYDRPALLDAIGETRGLAVLDAGGGIGTIAVELLRRGGNVWLCDIDPRCCEAARSIAGRWIQVDEVDLSARPWPYEDGRFDLVVMSLVLDLIDDLDVLREIPRVLRRKGRAVVSVRNPIAYGPISSRVCTETLTVNGASIQRVWFPRSFSIWLNAFAAHGLRVARCIEPELPGGERPWVVIFELVPIDV